MSPAARLGRDKPVTPDGRRGDGKASSPHAIFEWTALRIGLRASSKRWGEPQVSSDRHSPSMRAWAAIALIGERKDARSTWAASTLESTSGAQI